MKAQQTLGGVVPVTLLGQPEPSSAHNRKDHDRNDCWKTESLKFKFSPTH
jgi:hypothetical protein